MNYLDTNSLFLTVDNVSEALFFDYEINDNEKNKIVDFIIGQQGKPKTYANTFAPTEIDLKQDLILFTGERIRTNAGRCHMIGEESSRILRLIGGQSEKVQRALNRADLGLLSQMNSVKNNPRYIHGMYCCKSCTSSLWLNISSGGLRNDVSLLRSGIKNLKRYRNNRGSWNGFPSNYILYVLNEIDTELVLDELRYAGTTIERKLRRNISSEEKYDLRRKEIYTRILNKINMD